MASSEPPPFDPSNRLDEPFLQKGRFSVDGEDNTAVAGPGSTCHVRLQIVGRGNRLIVGRNCRIHGRIVVIGDGVTLSIGDRTSFNDVNIIAQHADITVGRWCMFAHHVEVRTDDGHALVDRASGKRINPSAPVTIGDHVWLGAGVTVAKGAFIAEDNMVGAGALVLGRYEETGTMLVGRPAVVKRRGVTWHRNVKDQFTPDELDYWRS